MKYRMIVVKNYLFQNEYSTSYLIDYIHYYYYYHSHYYITSVGMIRFGENYFSPYCKRGEIINNYNVQLTFTIAYPRAMFKPINPINTIKNIIL